jgi:hypothetical protein
MLLLKDAHLVNVAWLEGHLIRSTDFCFVTLSSPELVTLKLLLRYLGVILGLACCFINDDGINTGS